MNFMSNLLLIAIFSMTASLSFADSNKNIIKLEINRALKNQAQESQVIFLDQLQKIIAKESTIESMAKKIWQDVIPGTIQKKLDIFRATYHVPISLIENGETWEGLRKTLGVVMETGVITGTDFSWEKFRGLDKQFKESVIDEVLNYFNLAPVNWLTTGTVGFRSDIDNVADGPDYSAAIAKLLHDTLNVFMYGTTSGLAFDSEVYTQHLGATQKSNLKFELKKYEEEYLHVALMGGFYQLYNQTHLSDSLPWDEITKRFKEMLPDSFPPILEQVEALGKRYEIALKQTSQAFQKDKRARSAILELEKLTLDAKVVLHLSEKIREQQVMIDALGRQLDKAFIHMKKGGTQSSFSLNDFINTVENKENLMVEQSLIYEIRGVFFPESYISQEAFQYSVMSDASISQILQMLTKQYQQKIEIPKGLSNQCIRNLALEENSQALIKNTPLIHIVNLSEQLAYFIHRLDKPDTFSNRLIDASKYLERYLDSLISLYSQLQIDANNYPLLKKLTKLHKLSHYLVAIKRGRIPVYRSYVYETLNTAIKKQLQSSKIVLSLSSPSELDYTIGRIVGSLTDFINDKIVNSRATLDEKRERLKGLFTSNDDLPLSKLIFDYLNQRLQIKIVDKAITSRDQDFTLFLNILLGQSTLENQLINDNFDQLTERLVKEYGLNDENKFNNIKKMVIDSFFDSYNLYFHSPDAIKPKVSQDAERIFKETLDDISKEE